MSYESPSPADEVKNDSEPKNKLAPKKTLSPPASPTKRDNINLDDGISEDGTPVENPSG